jgi:hypothetical protein
MGRFLELLIVGRTPLGSGLRAAILGSLATFLWSYAFEVRTAFFLTGLVTALLIVGLAHVFSTRDDRARQEAHGKSPPA